MDKELLIEFIRKAKGGKRLGKNINEALESAGLKDTWKSMNLKVVAGRLVEHFNIESTGIRKLFND